MTSLRSYLLATLGVVMALLCIAATMLGMRLYADGRAQTERQLLDTTRALSLVVDGEIRGYEGMLVALGKSESLQANDLSAFDARARSVLSGPDAWIVLGDREGRQLVNTRFPRGARLPQGGPRAGEWAGLDRGRAETCNLVRRADGAPILCVTVPIVREGRAIYYLSAIFTPRSLDKRLAPQRLEGRFATLVDRNGVVVWRNVDPQRFVGTPARDDFKALVNASAEGVTQIASLEGVPVTLAFSRSQLSGWTCVISVPRAQLSKDAYATLWRGAIVATLLFLLGGVLGVLASRRVSDAAERLRNAADLIRDGQPFAFSPTGVREFDEVGETLRSAIAQRDADRERFELAQDVGDIGSWEWDTRVDEGRVSDSYKRMHGLQDVPGTLELAQVLAAIHPDDLSNFKSHLAKATQAEGSTSLVYRVRLPGGAVRYIAAKGRAIFDKQGGMIGAVGVVRDATGEHESAERLKRLNTMLEERVEARTLERDRLWDLARDAYVVADLRGVWLAASPAWTRILGWDPSQLIGKDSAWLEHPDDLDAGEGPRLGAGRESDRYTNRLRAIDGEYRWFSWTSVVEGDRIFGVARDITEERERERALREAEEVLRQTQKMESIGQITGGVAHDFNNLLTPIMATLDLLQQRGLPDARSTRMVGNALEAVERARMLVQRLLAFARRQPLTKDAVDLAALVRGLAALIGTTVGPKVEVNLAIEPDLPPALADANQLEMALLNLAVNARDAMPDGGQLKISLRDVRLEEDNSERLQPGRYLEIGVTDTGVGMPPTVLERAIEPFFSTKGIGRGTGLGLSMVHGLANQLGGALRIASAPGRGTAIHILLPQASWPAASAAPAGPNEAAPLQAGLALLIDDEPLARAAAAQMLEQLGYHVEQASSAGEGLRSLEGGLRPSVLVTDHLMPGMSGVELAREVRTRWPKLPVLVVSGYADVDDIAPDLPRLSKPFRQDELARALVRLERS